MGGCPSFAAQLCIAPRPVAVWAHTASHRCMDLYLTTECRLVTILRDMIVNLHPYTHAPTLIVRQKNPMYTVP